MPAIVHAEQAAYRCPQNNLGLMPTSIHVQPGERLLVTGPSGCGKSTLARCLAGLIPHLYHGSLLRKSPRQRQTCQPTGSLMAGWRLRGFRSAWAANPSSRT